MKNYVKIISVFVLCFASLCAQAQTVAPWFRGTKAAWETLLRQSFTTGRLAAQPLTVPFRTEPSRLHVKTNSANWLAYRTSHSQTLSTQEKEILKQFPQNILSMSGKLTYFQDRSLLLLNAQKELFPLTSWSEKAFARHQEILSLARSEIETFDREKLISQLHTWVAKHDVENLLQDPDQPLFFVITRDEMLEFASLSLEEQQTFAAKKYTHTQKQLSHYLSSDPHQLTTDDFSLYYLAKTRAGYFHLLMHVLQRADQPRLSIILRVTKMINLPFLPHPAQHLTDAQRLGKLLLYADQPHRFTPQQIHLLQQELARQKDLYTLYAEAEAFNIPYHRQFDLYSKSLTAEDVFGTKQVQKIYNLTEEAVPQRVPQVLEKIKARQALLRTQPPSADVYMDYFRLHHKKQFYEILQTRHQLRSALSKPLP